MLGRYPSEQARPLLIAWFWPASIVCFRCGASSRSSTCMHHGETYSRFGLCPFTLHYSINRNACLTFLLSYSTSGTQLPNGPRNLASSQASENTCSQISRRKRRIPDRENARGPLAKAPNVVGIGNHGAPGTRQHPRTAAHPLTKEAVSGQWNTIEELRVQQQKAQSVALRWGS